MRRFAPLCAALVCALIPSSAAAAPKASDFELRVGTTAAAPTARAASAGHDHGSLWTSKVLRAKRTFQVFGLKWDRAPEDLHAEVRVAEPGGPWRKWTEVGTADSGAHGSDPIWAGGANRVQVRVSGKVTNLRLHLVRVTGEPAAAAKPRVTARAAARQAGTGQPPIIPRAQWGGDQCQPRDTPSMGTVQMAAIHHTVSANDYSAADSAAMVLGICRFHRNSNGWDDVGYNFFVDKYGQIFEGRAGGIDQPVVGAQMQGWNAQSTGISNLGTYQDVPQTDAAITAMAKLIAWKLPLHGVPVTGTVPLVSAGGETNKFPSGTTHVFERISGHRDGNATACPGDQLYAQLPRIRQLAEAGAPDIIGAPQPGVGATSKLTLSASRLALSYPEPAQLTGRLTDAAGTPIAGQRVKIQVLTAKGFKAVSSAVTQPDGAFTASLPTSRNRTVRALLGSIRSAPVKVTVAPTLLVRKPARQVKIGHRAVVSGTVRPREKTLVIEAARQVGPGRYVLAKRVSVRARGGAFRGTLPLGRAGLYRLRVRVAGDAKNTPAQADFYTRVVRKLTSSAAGTAGSTPAPAPAAAPGSAGGGAAAGR
ncbi:MAG TPA: N-acetylmuramoyl-L-alanine amidase [Solirubrobacteraceae bacterium]|nr:N-acetylmuramoyl-L-alanine amidase [Solirubrobacteraceae bacterium]